MTTSSKAILSVLIDILYEKGCVHKATAEVAKQSLLSLDTIPDFFKEQTLDQFGGGNIETLQDPF